MKYNYYVMTEPNELYQCMFADLEHTDGVVLNASTHKLMGWKYPLWRIHTGKDFNAKVKLPYKSVWNKSYFRRMGEFANPDKPICFVMSGMWVQMAFELGFCETIRAKYPNAKIVWYLTDLVAKFPAAYFKKDERHPYPDMCKASRMFDMIVSFDQGDCNKYGLTYYPLLYSSMMNTDKEPDYDIYFCGKAKDRLPQIIKAYEYLKGHGLKLDFYLTGVPRAKQIYPDEITYGSGISYKENVERLNRSKAMLEIMQKGGSGYTIRCNEVVCFDKKLITNNANVKDAPFYNQKYISIFVKPDATDIDMEFLKELKNSNEPVDYHYKEKMSPVELLKFIDERI